MGRPAKYAFDLLLTEPTIEIPLFTAADANRVRAALFQWTRSRNKTVVTHVRDAKTEAPYLEITTIGDRSTDTNQDRDV